MTSEEWLLAEKSTLYSYDGCKLMIDGYGVELRLEPETLYKKHIAVYVNGKIEGKWLFDDCEERRRFFQPRTRTISKNKAQKELFKRLSKKQQSIWNEKSKYTYYWPYWGNFASLKRHLIANNKSIELVENKEKN